VQRPMRGVSGFLGGKRSVAVKKNVVPRTRRGMTNRERNFAYAKTNKLRRVSHSLVVKPAEKRENLLRRQEAKGRKFNINTCAGQKTSLSCGAPSRRKVCLENSVKTAKGGKKKTRGR